MVPLKFLKESFKLKLKNKPIKQKNKVTTKFNIKNSEINNYANRSISGKFGDVYLKVIECFIKVVTTNRIK